ncbi:hypothetical protein FQN57_005410 [Myotisia sp. PD_48]|nr:hypothetical protein FQN57_005410 [Myotisia sp. PD_48]
MSDSDLSSSSSLSSVLSTADESVAQSVDRSVGIQKYFKKAKLEPTSSPKRPPSPPHEYVLADNPDIAFIVMFRSRFTDVFPKSLPHFGPQDIERGVTELVPGDHIERLLCALLGLVLNRKKDVERGHYQRAFEEAIHTHASQWPKAWEGKNPLHGGGSFATMTPDEKLALLKTLVIWALSSSDTVQTKIKESYKQTRHDHDRNQPLSVQHWGTDGSKRRYWLIEGLDDTHFRLYRESPPTAKKNTWWSVAGTIPELRAVAESLATERFTSAKELSQKIINSIPRFEGSEEKRKRRDYRQARKAAFARPPSGFSLYEGRTRGKRMKYTFSDEEEDFSSEAGPTRKTSRFQSGTPSPPDANAPVFTASGRQVRSRAPGGFGQTVLGKRSFEGADDSTDTNGPGVDSRSNGRSLRSRGAITKNGWVGSADEEDDAESSRNGSERGDEYVDFGADDEEEEEDEESSGARSAGEDDFDIQQSLIVKLKLKKRAMSPKKTPKLDLATADHSNDATAISVPYTTINGSPTAKRDPSINGSRAGSLEPGKVARLYVQAPRGEHTPETGSVMPKQSYPVAKASVESEHTQQHDNGIA